MAYSGNGTYYVLKDQLLKSNKKCLNQNDTPQTSPADSTKASQISSVDKGGIAVLGNFPEISESLKQKINTLGDRAPSKKFLKNIIKELCAIKPLTSNQLANILNRNHTHLRYDYLSKMIKNKELEFIFPNQPAHPQQAYITPKE